MAHASVGLIFDAFLTKTSLSGLRTGSPVWTGELYLDRVHLVVRKPSPQTLEVLRALADDPTAWRHGYELGRELGLKAGSLYPILIRLADRGLLETSWEEGTPAGRPRRHLYRLSAAGAEFVAANPAAQAPAAQARAIRLRTEGA